jgi:hypothetical protein
MVADIFHANNVEEMWLMDVKRSLQQHAKSRELWKQYCTMLKVGFGGWMIWDFDDRFENNMKNLPNFEIVRKEVAGRKRRILIKRVGK